MNDEKNSMQYFALIAIVSIVAIVALVVMINGNKNTSLNLETSIENGENLMGQAQGDYSWARECADVPLEYSNSCVRCVQNGGTYTYRDNPWPLPDHRSCSTSGNTYAR